MIVFSALTHYLINEPMTQWLKILPEVQETQEMWVQSLGGEGSLSKEMAVSVPLQYSYLENPMDRGAWWVTVQKVQESDMTELKHRM